MRDYKKTVSDLRNFNANYESNKLTNDAADAIEELLAKVESSENRHVVESEMIDEMHAEIERLKAKVPAWISVEERLPEDDKYVLCVDEGDVIMGFYVDECGWGDMDKFRIYPTHWMLRPKAPEPPKGVE